MKKKALIWGAGKIGRGFAAEIFQDAGCDITFIDINEELINALKAQGFYTLYHCPGPGEEVMKTMTGFSTCHTGDVSELQKQLLSCHYMAVVVFPSAFEQIVNSLVSMIRLRKERGVIEPLDVLLCANTSSPATRIRSMIEERVSAEEQVYFEEYVGLIETIIMRIAIEPPPELKENDPLVVQTNGYPTMPIDRTAFKGNHLRSDMLLYTENIHAEEVRKMYTYNLLHVVFAYMGLQKGYTLVEECVLDKEIMDIAEGALDEVSKGLQHSFGFTPEEMVIWNAEAIKNMSNPVLKDSLSRVGGDPKRKLQRNDRVVGPALLCRSHGFMPYYLTKIIAGGFLFDQKDDPSCQCLRDMVDTNGIRYAIEQICGLEKEPDLVQLSVDHYKKAIQEQGIKEDLSKVSIMKHAYEKGFYYERLYRGCAQCMLAAMFDVTDHQQPMLFQAASGLSGGIAITGDGSCGGYTGGILLMGTLAGRRLDRIPVDGDKEMQYLSYEMGQLLHDRFEETYGSVTCEDIHRCIFDQAYCLRTKAVRDEFEEAGAHKDKCTTVIALSAAWAAEILYDKQLLATSCDEEE